MLYHLLVPLVRQFKVLNLFTYITFRAAGAAVTALVLAFIAGPVIIRRLRGGAVTQGVRDGTPDTHAGKGDTPTMGGLIILFAALVSTLLWARLGSRYIWLALVVTAGMGAIGLVDDLLKLRQKRAGRKNEGLVERYKLAGQVTIGLLLGWYVWQYPLAPDLPGASTTLPFFKYLLVVPISAAFAWVYVLFTAFVLTGV
ncbi:MAG: phospho-N-acetylmuramoyl-pentapeptide-transferase, partial [Gemmatimonadetes bacterium 21-71-4]